MLDRDLPKDLVTVKCAKERGRAVYAKRDISKGELLFKQDILRGVLNWNRIKTHCSSCFQSLPSTSQANGEWREKHWKPTKCSGCQIAMYCSTKCQRRDWPYHRDECPVIGLLLSLALTATANDQYGGMLDVTAAARLAWRCLMGSRQDHTVEQIIKDMYKAPEGTSIVHPLANQQPIVVSYAHQQRIASQVAALLKLSNLAEAEFLEICVRISTNWFGLTDEEFQPVGIGIVPGVALLNHDCDANVLVVMCGPAARIVATKDICKDGELLVSYVDPNEPASERENKLATGYYFVCKCEKCVQEAANGSLAVEGQEIINHANGGTVASYQQLLKEYFALAAACTQLNRGLCIKLQSKCVNMAMSLNRPADLLLVLQPCLKPDNTIRLAHPLVGLTSPLDMMMDFAYIGWAYSSLLDQQFQQSGQCTNQAIMYARHAVQSYTQALHMATWLCGTRHPAYHKISHHLRLLSPGI